MAYTKQEIAVYEKIRLAVVGGQLPIAGCVTLVLISLRLWDELHLEWWKITAPLWLWVLQFVCTAVHIAAMRTANGRQS